MCPEYTRVGVASAVATVLIARVMFTACRRRDLQDHGSTPALFRVVDPYIAGLVENLYRSRNVEKTCVEDHHGHNAAKTGIFRARLRRDGFVSADAGYAGGEFTTPVMTFAGRTLTLNMDGSAGGWLQVELLTERGKPIPGYRLRESDVVRGNNPAREVTWQGKSDLSKLAATPMRVRFVMRSMKLYTFQFRE